MRRHVLVGIIAALLLFLVYVGIVTWAEGFAHVFTAAPTPWYWLVILTIGFGTQAGMFSFIRHGMRERRKSATASVATSGSVSAVSMAACCAHHLADVLPFIGLAGVATFVTDYQLLFIVAGVLSNLVGITVMLETIQCQGLSRRLSRLGWNLGRVKKGAMASSALGLAAAVTVYLVT
jgi:hypothetical protein